MNRCATCKHWDRGGEEFWSVGDEPLPSHRRCMRVTHLNREPGTEDRARKDMSGGDSAYLMDASGYAATLWAHHDFGCVLHEERDG